MELCFVVFTILQIVYFYILRLKIPAYEVHQILQFLYVYLVIFNILPQLIAHIISNLNKKIDEAEKFGRTSEISKFYSRIWYWQTSYVVIYNFRAFLNLILSIVFLFQLDSSEFKLYTLITLINPETVICNRDALEDWMTNPKSSMSKLHYEEYKQCA